VIPAYNSAPTLAQCLLALQHQTRAPDEIIVVDDGSTDETFQVAERIGADVIHQPRQGPAAARNRGAQHARGEVMLFTDADCEPSPEWVARMSAAFADPPIIATKGSYRTRQRQLIARLIQLEYEFRYERMARFAQIDFVDSSSAGYRRAAFLRAGGFDTTFPMPSVEDIDLAFRLARQGCRMIFVRDAWVWHQHPVSLSKYLRRKAQYGWWRARIYLRHPDKIRGDTHTEPALKMQFALLALIFGSLAGALVGQPFLLLIAALALIALVLTTFPFVRWAWSRDVAVALVWMPITLLRVLVQGAGLALGLIYYGLFDRCR
jgi:cellulose synthase/poly-beta-1,6-N-acetylglucosamine synthase-like glycosyltransferase